MVRDIVAVLSLTAWRHTRIPKGGSHANQVAMTTGGRLSLMSPSDWLDHFVSGNQLEIYSLQLASTVEIERIFWGLGPAGL